MGRRLRDRASRGVGRRRPELAHGDARPGLRPLLVPAVEFSLRRRPTRGTLTRDGEGDQSQRRDADVRAHCRIPPAITTTSSSAWRSTVDVGRLPMKIWIAVVGALAVVATTVVAAEQKVDLKAGPGRDKVEANCVACHSLDYISAELAVHDSAGVGGRSDQDDQGVRRADQRAPTRRRSSTTSPPITARREVAGVPRSHGRGLPRRRGAAARRSSVPSRRLRSPAFMQHALRRVLSGWVTPMIRWRPRSSKP